MLNCKQLNESSNLEKMLKNDKHWTLRNRGIMLLESMFGSYSLGMTIFRVLSFDCAHAHMIPTFVRRIGQKRVSIQVIL